MRTVVGVMGGGLASEQVAETAYRLGQLIATNGWVLLNGGRDTGVMAASARGASEAGGFVVGVLPDSDWERAAPDLDVAVLTGMGDARNEINVLSSRVVVALRGGAGTLSEIALAIKAGRPVVAVDFPLGDAFEQFVESGMLVHAATPEEAVLHVGRLLDRSVR